jgi:hypothetical protein
MGERARWRTSAAWPLQVHAGPESATTAGKLAAQSWLRSRRLSAPAMMPWHIEVSLDVRDAPAEAVFDERRDTRFRIEVYSEEWGLFFCHQSRASWIRVTDIPFVHGRDDFHILPTLPALKDVGPLVRSLEREHAITFRRERALILTNVPSAEPAIKLWVGSL